MSDGGLPEHGSKQHGEAGDAESEPNKTDFAALLYGPFPFIESLVREAREHRGKYKTHRDYTHAMQKAFATALGWITLCCNRLFNRRMVNPWIAIFTFVLTIATIAQWWMMSDQNELMREEARQYRYDSRAIMTAASARMAKPAVGKPIDYAITLVNAGKSHAVITATAIDHMPSPKSDIDKTIEWMITSFKLYLDSLHNQNRHVYAGHRLTINNELEDIVFAEELPAIESGETVIVAMLAIRYEDGIGGMHDVGFFFRWDPVRNKMLSDSKYGFIENWD